MNKWENQSARNILALLTSDEYTNRKQVLEQVCTAFNNAGIRYALSCSAALFLQGLVDEFNDFDILVYLKDKEKIEKVFSKIGGTLEVTIQKNAFSSPYYREAIFQKEHFDLVGDMTVITYNSEYCYRVVPDEIIYQAIEGNIIIPVIPVDANFLLYAMMEGWQGKRVFKKNLCLEYLNGVGISYPDIFKKALKEEHLPPHIRDMVKDLLDSVNTNHEDN